MTSREPHASGTWELGALLAGIVEHSLTPDEARRRVRGLRDDSREVGPDSVFVAIRGTSVDGRRFVLDAVSRGATVVIVEEPAPISDALVIRVPDAREVLARLAFRWHGLDKASAAGDLKLLGVTGTNGKTSVAHLTQVIAAAAGVRCGMLGTIRHDLCERVVPAHMTTPGPLETARHLAECRAAGAGEVVMEVSSHALDQRRVAGLRFAAAAFTNLTQDHLDYHETMDAYCSAKARLFEQVGAGGVAVINADDPRAGAVVGESRARVLTYALESDADITAFDLHGDARGTRFRLRLPGGELRVKTTLVGRHNVYNALAAAGLSLAVGVPIEAIERGLDSAPGAAGRLQRLASPGEFDVFVDYAHTPDALRSAASALRPLARQRLMIVFGCGGERDRLKRPLMARAVAELGDVLILTSDNPRSEDPRRIIEDALRGFDAKARRRVIVEPDRRMAIHAAIAAAKPGDVVMIAGKGHETVQIIGDQRVHFDDVEVAREAFADRNKLEGAH